MTHNRLIASSAIVILGLLLVHLARAQEPGPATGEDLPGPERVVAEIYDLVGSTGGGKTPDWDAVRTRFIKEAVVVLRTSQTATTVFSLNGFIQDFIDFYEKPFRRGDLTIYPKQIGFTEKIIRLKAWQFWDMAQVLVLYEAHITNDPVPPQRGIDNWLLSRRDGRWVIVAVTNDLVTKDHPVPPELTRDK